MYDPYINTNILGSLIKKYLYKLNRLEIINPNNKLPHYIFYL